MDVVLFNILAGFIEHSLEFLIRPAKPAHGLVGALGTASHGAERIRVAGHSAIQLDHHQDECQVIRGGGFLACCTVDQFIPGFTAQTSQGLDHA